MAVSNSVKLAAGEQGRTFAWPTGSNAVDPFKVPTYTITTAPINSLPQPRDYIYEAFLAFMTAGTTPTATVQMQGTIDPLTGVGVTIQCTLASNTTIIPTNPNAFAAVPLLWAPNNPLALLNSGMLAIGIGLPIGVTISAVGANTATLSSAATATGSFPVTFFNLNWVSDGSSLSVSGTPPASAAGGTSNTSWRWMRANVSAIAGAGATLQVMMGG